VSHDSWPQETLSLNVKRKMVQGADEFLEYRDKYGTDRTPLATVGTFLIFVEPRQDEQRTNYQDRLFFRKTRLQKRGVLPSWH